MAPRGQQLPIDSKAPIFGPCKLLDFELEMAFVTGEGKPLGDSISVDEAEDYILEWLFSMIGLQEIFRNGICTIRAFLAKNSPPLFRLGIITLDALEPLDVKEKNKSLRFYLI